MARTLEQLLAYEMRRKPELAALHARAATLTDAEIDNLGYLRWIRDALRSERSRQHRIRVMAETSRAMEGSVVHGFRADPVGETRRWTASAHFIEIDRGSSLEVRQGTLVWLPEDQTGIWIRTTFSARIDPAFGSTVPVGRMTKTGYTAFYKAEDQRSMPQDIPVLLAQDGCASPLHRLGFAFFRP